MRVRGAAGCLALALASGGAGCLSSTAFECASASDCQDAGVEGRCEDSGFCSFPDATCPSEHRYGDHAGGGLGGMCVPDEDGTTDGDTTDPSTTSTLTATDPTLAETTSADETPLTDGPDGSSGVSLEGSSSFDTSTSVDATTETSTDEDSSTGGVVCPTFADDFDNGMIHPSWTLMDGDFVHEEDGVLLLELTPEVDQVFPGVNQSGLDLADGWVRMRVGQPPGTDFERLYLAVAVDPAFSEVVYVLVEGGVLYARHEIDGMFTDLGTLDFDPDLHWVQIRGEGDSVVFEASADAATFVPIATIASPFPLLDTTIVVASTNFAELPMATTVSVEDVELCEGA